MCGLHALPASPGRDERATPVGVGVRTRVRPTFLPEPEPAALRRGVRRGRGGNYPTN